MPGPPAARPYPALPPGFRIGTASSAFQVEGALDVDGRGPSIWDTFCALPGRIADGSTAAVAADSYRRLDDDLALLRGLGAGAHRFSFAWPRLQPTGRGRPEPRGLAHYDRLVDGLLEAGIEPMATLYHWDLPQALEDDGGWLNRATVDAFADYAALVADRFADRVAHWVPVNEPSVVMVMGHAIGLHAPGRALMMDSFPVGHHLLLAHGRAVAALRAAGATSVGCANNHAPMWPASDDAADVGATKLFDAVWNGMFLEPMLLGRYPDDLAAHMSDYAEPGDAADLRAPLDFYGVNFYTPMKVAAAPADAPMPFALRPLLGHPTTDLGWSVVPEALREWLITTRARYRAALPPIMVTEVGAAYDDGPAGPGGEPDQRRIDYLHGHLDAVAEACARGVDVRGLYVWSLLDSFEWSDGLRARFGLVHVDHATGERTPRASYGWLKGLVAAQTPSLG